MTDEATRYWEQRYNERDRIWSGEPNAALVTIAADLPPGRALDLGCGEGGDACWLAGHGWRVTAVDVSARAVERGRALAAERGVADRIEWVVADLAGWQPTGEYQLVTSCFLHSPIDFPRTEVLRRAAATVASGGHLLVVGHAEPPPWSRYHGHEHHLPTPEEDLADLALDGSAWVPEVVEVRERPATGPEGQQATLRDSVVLVRRQ